MGQELQAQDSHAEDFGMVMAQVWHAAIPSHKITPLEGLETYSKPMG